MWPTHLCGSILGIRAESSLGRDIRKGGRYVSKVRKMPRLFLLENGEIVSAFK